MKKNDSREVCKKYNEVRENHCSRELSKDGLLSVLNGVVPGLPTYLTTAVKFGLVIKERYGYSLPSEPVYIGRVENYLKEYRKAAADANSKRRAKSEEAVIKQTNRRTNQPEIMDENDLIEKAISVLKETGDYRILKKVVTITWEEV